MHGKVRVKAQGQSGKFKIHFRYGSSVTTAVTIRNNDITGCTCTAPYSTSGTVLTITLNIGNNGSEQTDGGSQPSCTIQ